MPHRERESVIGPREIDARAVKGDGIVVFTFRKHVALNTQFRHLELYTFVCVRRCKISPKE